MQTETPVIGGSTAPPPLVFTDAAANKVSELIQDEDNPNLKLRVFVSGGGCTGLRSTKISRKATARSKIRA